MASSCFVFETGLQVRPLRARRPDGWDAVLLPGSTTRATVGERSMRARTGIPSWSWCNSYAFISSKHRIAMPSGVQAMLVRLPAAQQEQRLASASPRLPARAPLPVPMLAPGARHRLGLAFQSARGVMTECGLSTHVKDPLPVCHRHCWCWLAPAPLTRALNKKRYYIPLVSRRCAIATFLPMTRRT